MVSHVLGLIGINRVREYGSARTRLKEAKSGSRWHDVILAVADAPGFNDQQSTKALFKTKRE